MSDHKNYGQSGIGPNVEIGKKGPRVKNNSDVIEHRNNADDDFVVTRGAPPVGDNDYVTKKYLETSASISVSGQIDGGSPPAGSFTGEIRIVTTAGGSFGLKELYRWDGSAWEEVNRPDGLRISITTPLTGGTDEYLGDHVYLWDETGDVWVDVGPTQSVSNIVRARRVTIDFNDADGAINIGDLIPANAIVLRGVANVTQAFDGTNPSLEVGDAGDTDRFAATNEICLDTVGLYKFETYHLYGADTQAIATLVKGAGNTQGQVSLVLEYHQP